MPRHVKGYTLISAIPTFNVSDARSVDNGLDSPISATFKSEQSRTYTITTSAGTTASLMGFLTANVSATITQSRTTAIGVSSTVTVPARSRVLGEYGVDAYIVTYDVQSYGTLDGKKCNDNGSPVRETRNAPTIIETWRFRLI